MSEEQSKPNQTLKSLIALSNEIESQLIESEGVLTPELEAMLELKDSALPVKVDNYAHFMDRLDLSVDYFKRKEAEFQHIRKGLESTISHIKGLLKNEMLNSQLKSLEGNEYKFTLSNSKPKVVIDDENQIHEDYKKTEIVSTVSKDLIFEALKSGQQIEGAHLEESYSLRKSMKGRK